MTKSTRMISMALKVVPSVLLLISASMKFIQAKPIVEGFNKSGLGNYLLLIALIELTAVVLFWIPRTTKIGFLLLCSYLGGAICVELASGQFPSAAVFLALLWLSVFLSNRNVFLNAEARS